MTADAMKADAMKADAIQRRAADQRAEFGHAVAPPLAPSEPAVDLAHLSRMTLGESGLEREVLDLFDRQAAMLRARMASASPRMVVALAHTAAEPGVIALTSVMDHLAVAIAEVHAVIGELQRAD